jgi:D-sedoheptulose 7-phosphate isomerase
MSELQTITSTIRQTDFARAYMGELKKCLDSLPLEHVAAVIECLAEAYRQGKQVFIMGNGGSAATASHMACDLGKNILPRGRSHAARRFKVTALTDNVPWITAVANDLGYECVFAEQLRNLVERGDLVIAISGSGNSPNIIEGLKVARESGAKAIGILGFDGGKARSMVDLHVIVNAADYGPIEDIHMVLDHLITAWFRAEVGSHT